MIWVIRKKDTDTYLQDNCKFGDLQSAYVYSSEAEAVAELYAAEEEAVPAKLVVPTLRFTANIRPREKGKLVCDFCSDQATYHWGGPAQGCLCDRCKEKVRG